MELQDLYSTDPTQETCTTVHHIEAFCDRGAPKLSEAPHLRSSTPPPKTDFTAKLELHIPMINTMAARAYSRVTVRNKMLALRRFWVVNEPRRLKTISAEMCYLYCK